VFGNEELQTGATVRSLGMTNYRLARQWGL
jgi:hypothetical protein